MIAAGRNKVRGVTVRSDLHDFLLREAAEIEGLTIGIPGKAFWNEIFFFRDEHQTRVSFDGKIAVNLFDEFRKFVRAAQPRIFRAGRGIKTFCKRDALLQKLDCFQAFSKVLVGSSKEIMSGAAIGKLE